MSAQQKKHPFDFKTQYGLGFSTQDDEIVVDFFCVPIRGRSNSSAAAVWPSMLLRESAATRR
jgi:hypothetical protein